MTRTRRRRNPITRLAHSMVAYALLASAHLTVGASLHAQSLASRDPTGAWSLHIGTGADAEVGELVVIRVGDGYRALGYRVRRATGDATPDSTTVLWNGEIATARREPALLPGTELLTWDSAIPFMTNGDADFYADARIRLRFFDTRAPVSDAHVVRAGVTNEDYGLLARAHVTGAYVLESPARGTVALVVAPFVRRAERATGRSTALVRVESGAMRCMGTITIDASDMLRGTCASRDGANELTGSVHDARLTLRVGSAMLEAIRLSLTP